MSAITSGVELDSRAVDELATSFGGSLIRPDDASYDDQRRIWNGSIDRRPALIARCAGVADVISAVRFAREHGERVAMRSGGHSYPGLSVCDGGMVIDLGQMKGIRVDPEARTARAQAGVLLGDLDREAQAFGLAVPAGIVTHTGLAGLTLGGGIGWLERKYGLTIDQLLSVDVVTAEGEFVRASEEQNADLFWGMRGGGGNFGIVTAFHLRLHAIGPIVLGGQLMYPFAMARDLMRFYRDFILAAPDEAGGALAFITAPPEEFVPEPVRGQPVVGVVVVYAGDVAEGEEVFKPLREFGPPAIDMVQPMPYVAVQQLIDAPNPKGLQNYWNADFYAELPDEAIDVFLEHAQKPASPMTQTIVMPAGGAIARVPEDATAFGQRDFQWHIHYLSMWPDPADTEANIVYTRAFSGAMKQWATGRAYLNMLGDEGLDRVQAAYGPEKFARLQELKAKWDPTNLFRHNQNIPPA